MSEKDDKMFKYLLERFFKEGTKAENFKDLKKLGLDCLKVIDKYKKATLEELKVKTIGDLVKYNPEKLVMDLRENFMVESDIDSIIVAAKILKRAIAAKAKSGKERVAKVAILGLQNAGKTSFINSLVGRTIEEKLQETSPTVSVAHQTVEIDGMQIAIWDFGGQENFRKEYLENPEEFFVNTEVLLYMVDVQDEDSYADSLEYLFSILTILEKLKVKASIIVDFHKCDPDLINDIDFIVRTQWLEDKFKEILEKFNLPYHTMRSSIYSDFLDPEEPELAKSLKDLFKRKAEQIGQPNQIELLRNLLYIQTKAYTNMMTQLVDLSNQLAYISQQVGYLASRNTLPPGAPAIEGNAPGTVTSGETMQGTGQGFVPPRIKAPPPVSFKPVEPGAGPDPRSSILSELKDILRKRRMEVP